MQGRDLVKKVKKKCERCRYLRMKAINIEMGPVLTQNVRIAPAFYATQVHLCGLFKAYSPHNKRTTIKIWLAVYCCIFTSTTLIKVMEDYSTTAFIQSFVRFSCEVGYPKFLSVDEGSQLVKGFESIKLTYTDINYKLHKDSMVEFDTCPVEGRNSNEKVERRIRQIKEYFEKTIKNERPSALQWETLSSVVANTINDLPIRIANIISDYENMDLITPNQLRLGRNNDRSPTATMEVTGNPDRISKENKKIFNSWFEAWLISHVPRLMNHPKWFSTDHDMKTCDVLLFLKQDGALSNSYQYGIVNEIIPSKDGVIRKVIVQYRNDQENVDRYTARSVRDLVLIHPTDELILMEELGKVA